MVDLVASVVITLSHVADRRQPDPDPLEHEEPLAVYGDDDNVTTRGLGELDAVGKEFVSLVRVLDNASGSFRELNDLTPCTFADELRPAAPHVIRPPRQAPCAGSLTTAPYRCAPFLPPARPESPWV